MHVYPCCVRVCVRACVCLHGVCVCVCTCDPSQWSVVSVNSESVTSARYTII